MRSKRTPKTSSIKPGKSAPVGREQHDQTTLLSAEDARREAERKYRDIFDNAVEGIFQTTADGQTVTANPALARMLGFESAAELIAIRTNIGEQGYVRPARRSELGRLVEQRGSVQDFEFECYRKDGSIIWLSENVRAVRDASGTLLYYEGTVEDVTERKRAEEALRDAERKYRDIYENAVEGIFQIKPGGGFISTNPALARMLGFDSPEELISARSDPARVRYVNPPLRAEYLRRLAEEDGLRDFEYEDYRKDGSVIWLSDNIHAVRDSEGTLLYYQGTTQDITVRKLAEHALRESEERYRDLVENSRDLICTHDLDGLVLSANPAAAVAVGYDLDEFVEKKNIRDLLAPEVKHQFDQYMARLRTEGATSGIMLVQTKSGERRIWEYYNSLRTEGVATPIVRGMARDITERKQAENALQESEERFRQLSEAPFEAIVLHDQGTILDVNQSFCRMYGYERAEVIGKSVLELTPPKFREPLRQRVRSGGADSYDGLALRKDGTIFRAELAGKPIHYQGRAVRVAAIHDITEQKRNERRQAAQYAVTRALAESATLAEATPQLLQVICESLHWKMGEFWRVCDSTNLLRCVETWHVPALDATSFIAASRQTELAPGVGLPGRVWQSGQPDWIPDVMTDPRFARAAIAGKVGLRGAVAFPILLGNCTLGVMQFFSSRILEGDEDLLKILSAIGSQIGQFTERKRAEEALRQSEVYFRSLIEHAADTISTYDANGVRLYTSPSIERVLGYKPEEMIGQSGFELLHPDDRPLLASLFAQGVQIPGTKVTKELRCLCKDGTWRTLESTASNLLGNPDVGAVVLNSRDITERRRAEEALRESEERYRDLVENIQDLVCTHDLEGRVLSANPALEKLLGYNLNDFGQRPFREILAPEARDRFDDYLVRIRRDGVANGLMLVQTSTGERRVWEYHNTLRTEGVATPIVRSMARDITEKRRAEKAAAELRRELELTMNAMEEGIHRVNLDGNIVFENRAAARMLGWEVADLVGKRGHATMHHTRPDGTPYPMEECPIYASFRDGVSRQVTDEVFWRKDGTSFPVEYTTAPVRDDQNTLVATVVTFRDITEQRRAESSLRESEKKYRDLVETAHDLIWAVDAQGTITFMNQASRHVYGYEPAELIGRSYLDLLSPEERIRQLDALAGFLASGEKSMIGNESEVMDRDGNRHVLLANAVTLFDQQGNAIGTMGTSADITDRKRNQQALLASERRYRDLFTFAPVGIYQVKRDGTLITANKALAEMLAFDSVDEFLKVNLADVYVVPGGREQLIREYEAPGWAADLEIRWKRKDGAPIWVQLSAHAIKRADGTIDYFEGFVRNVNDRKLTEAALRESEERYRELFENDKDAIYVHDLNGVYTSVNRAAETLSGYPREEILGKNFRDLVAPEYQNHVRENLCKKLKQTGETNYEVEIINRNGELVPVEVSSRLIFEDGVVVGVQGSARDITDRKRARQALLTYSRRLVEAQEAERGRIARELHDQIGQMLTALKLNLHAIHSARDAGEAWLLIEDNLRMLDEAMEQVRDLSVDLRPLLLDDLGLVTALRWFVDHQAQRTNVRTEFTSDSLDPDLRFSPELETACFRIAQEALTNVIRHARAKTVTVRLSRNRDYLILLVEDDGVGFEVEALRGRDLTHATLGLRGMQERAHAVGGRVKIDSATDRGTQVFVELPIAMPNGARPKIQKGVDE